uniref:Ig-like domain-containing protein n=1 Tax=Oncorhynchus tshawytscha TaxID=74940 RepID=A0AAZ3RT95_ONCTS
MARIYVSALVLYGFCLTPVMLFSPPLSVVVHPGDNVTLQCTDVLKGPGHVAWFKQVNVSEPLCIASMYSSQPYVKHHNGFQPSHMEMFISNRIIVLKITEVDVADSGLYCCGMYNEYFIFTNMTFLMVQGYKDSDKEPEQCPDGPDSQRQPQNDQNQYPDSLIYAALNFTSKKRKMERRREKELDTHVVYAATR